MSVTNELQPSILFRAFDIAFFVPGAILFLAILFSYSEYSVSTQSRNNTSTNSQPAQSQPSAASATNPSSAATAKAPIPRSNVSLFDRIVEMQENQFSSIAILQVILLVLGSFTCGLICHAFSWCWHNFAVEWARKLKPISWPVQWSVRVLQFVFGLRPKDCEEFPSQKNTVQSSSDAPDETEGEGNDTTAGSDSETDIESGGTPVENCEGDDPNETFWITDEQHYARRVDYFWYLRATCWNASFAVLVGGALFLFSRWASVRYGLLKTQGKLNNTGWSDAIWKLDEVDPAYIWALVAVVVSSYLLFRIGTRFGSSCERRKEICKSVCEFHRASSEKNDQT